MPGRALFAALLVTFAFLLDGAVIYGMFVLFTRGVTMDAATFGLFTGFLGIIIGNVNTLAAQPVAWAFGSTVTSEKKTDTIQNLAGKG